MGDTGPFSVGEKVLVPHTDKFYEAKIQKAQFKEGQWHYHLHYTGWNKKWDEWVEQTGLQKAPAGGAGGQSGSGGGGGGGKKSGSKGAAGGGGSAAAGQKRKRPEELVPAGEAGAPGELLEIELPAALKAQLLAEHDAIHEDHKLVPLPREPCVDAILEGFLQHVVERQGSADVEEDLVAGLKLYFDKALVHCLLYKSERSQADKVLAGGRVPSSVYGAEHLLRLFVKLPELLPAGSSFAPEQQSQLATRLEDVLAYLQLRQGELLLSREGYVAPGAAC